MRSLNALLAAFYLIVTFVSALSITHPADNTEFGSKELLSSLVDASAFSRLLEQLPLSWASTAEKLTPEQEKLVEEVKKRGDKINPGEVLNIWTTTQIIKNVNGNIIWLETGNDAAGMKHIWGRHSKEFTAKGITETEIPNLIEKVTTEAAPVKYEGKGKKLRPVFKTTHGGADLFLAITIGSNGFVVGMNPCSSSTVCPVD